MKTLTIPIKGEPGKAQVPFYLSIKILKFVTIRLLQMLPFPLYLNYPFRIQELLTTLCQRLLGMNYSCPIFFADYGFP